MSAISGFPEFLPAQQYLFEQWKKTIATHFQRFAFIPLETPAVERLKTLLSKGEDHEIYLLQRYGESHSTYELGLRFDLTVPLARYVSSYHGHLVFPYRRYHIGPVWRGERPQEGRFRQFYQCDIDVIGQGQLSLWHESEVIFMMHELLAHLGIFSVLGPITWMINHRSLLMGWAARSGISSYSEALRIIDKRGKWPMDQIMAALKAQGATEQALNQIEQWSRHSGPWENKIEELKQLEWGHEFDQGLEELAHILGTLSKRGIPSAGIKFDPLLARGLGYYSGPIYEANLLDHPSLGSICAGGRYDHLTQTFSLKQKFPGVGLSLGLSRLFSFFLSHTSPSLHTGDLLVTTQDPSCMAQYLTLGQHLRSQDLNTEVYLEPHSLSQQLKYGHRKGFSFVLIANAQEMAHQVVYLKHLSTGEQTLLPFSDIAEHIKQRL